MALIRTNGLAEMVVGPLAATAALVAVGFVWLGLYTCLSGIFIAMGVASWAGACVTAMVDPPRAMRNAAIVAAYLVLLCAAYLFAMQAQTPPPGASHGGPNVPRPAFE